MSAPSGYNPSATMIAPSGGAIHAMSGGFSSSPYPPGMSAASSLLPDVKGAIDIYRGGANHVGGAEDEEVAVASVVSIIANEEANKIDEASIAVAAVVAIIANEDKVEDKDENKDKDTDKDEDITRELNIFGSLYTVSNPSKEIEEKGWDKLIESLHLGKLPAVQLLGIKKMIYNQPLCLSQDFQIATSMTCEPMRILINTVIKQSIESGIIDKDTLQQINLLFGQNEWLSALSLTGQTAITALNNKNVVKMNEATTPAVAATVAVPETAVKTATAKTATAKTATAVVPATVKTATTVVPGAAAATATAAATTTVVPGAAAPVAPAAPVASKAAAAAAPSDDLVSPIGIVNAPTIACYAITSFQYLFSIPDFVAEIMNWGVGINRSEHPAIDYDSITPASESKIIADAMKDATPYSVTGENQFRVKDALFYIVNKLIEKRIPFSKAATYEFNKDIDTPISISKAIMYLMTQYILYHNSSAISKNAFVTQQSSADFIRFIIEMCAFGEFNKQFAVVTRNTVKHWDGNFVTVPAGDMYGMSLIFAAIANNTIEQIYEAYQAPTELTGYMDPITTKKIDTEQKMEVDISNATYLHITINNTTNVPITINPNIILSGRPYRLIGTILYRGRVGGEYGHYRYVRMNSQPGIALENTPSILYDDQTVIYHNTLTAELVNQIQTQCRELLYVFTGTTSSAAKGAAKGAATGASKGGRVKRVIRKNKHVRNM